MTGWAVQGISPFFRIGPIEGRDDAQAESGIFSVLPTLGVAIMDLLNNAVIGSHLCVCNTPSSPIKYITY